MYPGHLIFMASFGYRGVRERDELSDREQRLCHVAVVADGIQLADGDQWIWSPTKKLDNFRRDCLERSGRRTCLSDTVLYITRHEKSQICYLLFSVPLL